MDQRDRGILDAATWRELHTPVPGALARDLALGHLALAGVYALVLAAPMLPTCLVAIAVAVAVQTRFAVVMHEGAHWLVHRDKAWNDRLTNWLAAFPIGMSVQRYRAQHLPHHARLGTPDDPDFVTICLPPVTHGLPASVLGCLTGARHLQLALKYLRGAGPRDEARERPPTLGILVWQAALLGVAVAAGRPAVYPVVWLLPLATVSVLVNELRSIAEHTPLVGPLPAGGSAALEPLTRTVEAGWVARTWFGPLHFNFHHEHHLHPGVPYSRLPALHGALRAAGYYERHPGAFGGTYAAVLRQLWRAYPNGRSGVSVTSDGPAFTAHRA